MGDIYLGLQELENVVNEYSFRRNSIIEDVVERLSLEGIITDKLPVFMTLNLGLNIISSKRNIPKISVWQKFRQVHNAYCEKKAEYDPITFDPSNWEYLTGIFIKAADELARVGGKYLPLIDNIIKQKS